MADPVKTTFTLEQYQKSLEDVFNAANEQALQNALKAPALLDGVDKMDEARINALPLYSAVCAKAQKSSLGSTAILVKDVAVAVVTGAGVIKGAVWVYRWYKGTPA